ncbi:MAG: hypothetical protein M3R02_08150 [Chloroflexota bacterium]|nr:hypothetical protein [Chloroflexota bacterium]
MAPLLNFASLTSNEAEELDALAAKSSRDPGGARFADRWDGRALSDAEPDRLEQLMRKAGSSEETGRVGLIDGPVEGALGRWGAW